MPNFKKPKGGFSAKFAAKRADSPFEAADAGLMAAIGDSEAKTTHMGKLIESKGKSERGAHILDNVQKAAALAAGVPPSALPDSGGEAEALVKIFGGGGAPKA